MKKLGHDEIVLYDFFDELLGDSLNFAGDAEALFNRAVKAGCEVVYLMENVLG